MAGILWREDNRHRSTHYALSFHISTASFGKEFPIFNVADHTFSYVIAIRYPYMEIHSRLERAEGP